MIVKRLKTVAKKLLINALKLRARYLRPLIERLGKDNSPSLIVFAYHGVTEHAGVERIGYGLQILKDDFERHCRIISANLRSSHIEEFLQQDYANNSKVCVLMTFDDVYRNVVSTALPLLEEYRLKFILFPSTNFVDSPEPFWWDKVRLAFLAAPSSLLDVGERVFDLSTLKAREESMFAFEEYLKRLDNEHRETLVTEVYTKQQPYIQSVFGKLLDELRPIDRKSLEALKGHPLCQIGLHSASHSVLPALSQERLEQELRLSQEWHEDLFHERAQDVCFPNGETDERVNDACQQFGFRRGFMLDVKSPARVRSPGNLGPSFLLINRYLLYPHDDSDSVLGKSAGLYDPFIRRFPWI